METSTLRNRNLVTARGNTATVYNVRNVGTRGSWTGLNETVRTYAVCAGVTVELEVGCSYTAERALAQAGL